MVSFPRTRLLAFVTVALCFVAAGAASAQRVTGQVVDTETGEAIQTVFVLLLDEAGARTAGTLTNASGHFVIEAPRPGRYRLLAERIGYQSTTSPPFELAAGQTLPYRFAVPSQPVQLEGVTATTERRCVVRPQEGVRLHGLWEEVRKALSVAVWTETQPSYRYEAVTSERIRDLQSLEIGSERQRVQTAVGKDPFHSFPARELVRNGYVQQDADGYRYFGIDAKHLLSEPFLDSHCFRVRAPGRQQAGLIGLAFEPAGRQRVPGVQGVLWLDARTAELQFLEYRYTRHLHPVSVPLEPFGGRTEFRRLDNGHWIVERWWIRMPEFHLPVNSPRLAQGAVLPASTSRGTGAALRIDARTLRSARLMIREVGSEVVHIGAASTARGPRLPRAVLEGVVFDSIGGAPLAEATVYLSGTGYSAVTDSAGFYRMEGLDEGVYEMSFIHPVSDGLNWAPPLREVKVAAGATTRLDHAVPSKEGLRASRCGQSVATPATGMASGQVRTTRGRPVAGAEVVFSWRGPWRHTPAGMQRPLRALDAVTDEQGRYLVCNLPMQTPISIEVRHGDVRGRAELQLRDASPAERHFTLPHREDG